MSSSRYAAFGPLHKKVQQLRSAQAEKSRIKTQALTWSSERETLVASGKCEDDRVVVAASTLQTKLAMVPFKEAQLDDLIRNVIDGIGPELRALRNELAAERDLLIKTAEEDFLSGIEPELNRFLPHAPDVASKLAQQAANASLPLQVLFGLNPIASQDIPNPADQAQSLLELAGTLERVRGSFFSGDKLNLDAVARKTEFRLTA